LLGDLPQERKIRILGAANRYAPPTRPERPEAREDRITGELDLDREDPVSFLLQTFGVEIGNAPMLPIAEDFHAIPLERTATFERMIQNLNRRRKEWSIDDEQATAWVLTKNYQPLGFLLEYEKGRFGYMHLDPVRPGYPEWRDHYQSWEDFRMDHWDTFLERVNKKADFQEADPSFHSTTLLRWDKVPVAFEERIIIPAFIDVFPAQTPFVEGLLKVVVSEIEKRKQRGREIKKILIIGSGAGPEAVALAKLFPDLEIHAIDKFDLEVGNSQASVAYHHLQDRVRVFKSDVFDEVMDTDYDMMIVDAPVPTFKEKETYDERYAEDFVIQLRSWLEDYPDLDVLNDPEHGWRSPLRAAARMSGWWFDVFCYFIDCLGNSY